MSELLNDAACAVLGGLLTAYLLSIEWVWPRFQRIREAWCTMFGHRPSLWFTSTVWAWPSPAFSPCVRCGESLPTYDPEGGRPAQ